MPKKRSVVRTTKKMYSLRCSSASIISLSLPEGILEVAKEEYDLKELRKWAKSVILREMVRSGILPFDLSLAIGRRGLLKVYIPRRDGSITDTTRDSA